MRICIKNELSSNGCEHCHMRGRQISRHGQISNRLKFRFAEFASYETFHSISMGICPGALTADRNERQGYLSMSSFIAINEKCIRWSDHLFTITIIMFFVYLNVDIKISSYKGPHLTILLSFSWRLWWINELSIPTNVIKSWKGWTASACQRNGSHCIVSVFDKIPLMNYHNYDNSWEQEEYRTN